MVMLSKLFYKILFYIRIFCKGLFIGIKSTDKLLTGNQKNINDSVFEVTDDGGGGVYKDLLEQKVTHEVEELRYTSYIVANESKKYKYIGNGNAVKKSSSELSERHGFIDESDNLPIILIQDNSLVCESVSSILNEVNSKENKKIGSDFIIKIKRDSITRFKIEEYIRKIVLKQSEGNYVLDLYCSKYPKQFSERKDRPFLRELNKIKNREIKSSDILDFNEISFITQNAWGIDDYYQFSFNDFEFYDIIEFDGNYIIRFGCQLFMKNLLDEIYSKSADEKYQKKEMRKNVVFDITAYNRESEIYDIDLNSLKEIKFSLENNDVK